MSTEITKHTNADLAEKMDWSRAMSAGNLLPQQYRNNPANLMFAAEYADALGISRIHVLTSIAVINGRPSPSADLMSAMVRTAGHKLRVTGDDTTATATLIRSDDPDYEFTATWDVAKATKAKLWGNKGPWSLYPAAMLRARAISEVVRMGASDVMAGGIYTPEEVGATVDADGNVINMPAERIQPQQQPTQATAATHIKDTLGGEPAPADAPQDVLDAIDAATNPDELTAIYEQHKAQPYLEVIRPKLTDRKNQLMDEQMESEHPTLDVEAEDVA